MEIQENIFNEDIEQEIDLLDIFNVLVQKISWIIVATILGAIISGISTKLFVTPIYKSSSQIYIFTKTTSITSLADLQMGAQLASDFEILGTSRPVVERVISTLGLETNYNDFVKTVTVENLPNSRILKITVENPDPQLAADISNEMANSLSSRVAEVMNTDKPSIVENSVVAEKASSPSLGKNILLGAILGFIVCLGIIIITYMLDDTIKSADDVEKYLRASTLAAIPIENVAKNMDKRKNKKS